MFYQESLKLYEKQPKIVEEFDSLLAYLTREMLDKRLKNGNMVSYVSFFIV